MDKSAAQFLKQHPDIEVLELFIIDANGVPRGKWAKPDSLYKACKGELRLPRSSFICDIWGESVRGSGLVVEAGDSDGVCTPVLSSLAPVPWLSRPAAQMLMSLNEEDGSPFYGDPRQVLAGVISRFKKEGLKPVIALEMEFYLTDKDMLPTGHPQAPRVPGDPRRYSETQLLNLIEMQDFEALFAAIDHACRDQNIPADSLIKENSPGQFEVNLNHHDDALLAADQAALFKRLVKGCAQQHGLIASFMAKPYAELAGSGMHMHMSVLDEKTGRNVFAMQDDQPTGDYAHAIAGVLETMADSLVFLAPHANSYRRFVSGSGLAPTTLSWGRENRTASVRLPLADPKATRLEHRVAGADANPYLVVAAILAGVHYGLTNNTELPAETIGNAYAQHPPVLEMGWRAAIQRAGDSAFVKDYFGANFQELYQLIKLQELLRFESTVTEFEYHSYLRHA